MQPGRGEVDAAGRVEIALPTGASVGDQQPDAVAGTEPVRDGGSCRWCRLLRARRPALVHPPSTVMTPHPSAAGTLYPGGTNQMEVVPVGATTR